MKRILLVEDVPLNRDLIVQLLEDHYQIAEAYDGQQGLDMAHGEHRPDIILMDLSLPHLDGWEAIKALKQDPETKNIPIIALTAHAMTQDRDAVIKLGCDDYLTKPIDEELLLKTIEQLLSQRHS